MMFVKYTIKYSPDLDSIYYRMLGGYDNCYNWKYDVIPFDFNLDEWINESDEIEEKHTHKDGEANIDFSVNIRFPVKDYAVLLDRMTEHNK